ncbi:UNVERIFIED_ORG: hypothetical protein FHR35_009179 [Microbispora rosea subsp. rosea]
MKPVDDGYQTAFDLAQVYAMALAAMQEDLGAAMEVAIDGSCLRFTAGPRAVLLEQGRTERPEGEITWMRLAPLTYAEFPGDATKLEFFRGCLISGGTRLLLMRCYSGRTGWIMTGNPLVDQRRHPYNVPERFVLLSGTGPTHFTILDLETGLHYREAPGRRPKQGGLAEMRELCERLNEETNRSGLTSSHPPSLPTIFRE